MLLPLVPMGNFLQVVAKIISSISGRLILENYLLHSLDIPIAFVPLLSIPPENCSPAQAKIPPSESGNSKQQNASKYSKAIPIRYVQSRLIQLAPSWLAEVKTLLFGSGRSPLATANLS